MGEFFGVLIILFIIFSGVITFNKPKKNFSGKLGGKLGSSLGNFVNKK